MLKVKIRVIRKVFRKTRRITRNFLYKDNFIKHLLPFASFRQQKEVGGLGDKVPQSYNSLLFFLSYILSLSPSGVYSRLG